MHSQRRVAILGTAQTILDASLRLRSARGELLAENIANADTPNYISRDLRFDSALQQAVDSGSANPDGQPVLNQENLKYDGNNVDVNQQLAQAHDNALTYVATLELYTSALGRLKSAETTTS